MHENCAQIASQLHTVQTMPQEAESALPVAVVDLFMDLMWSGAHAHELCSDLQSLWAHGGKTKRAGVRHHARVQRLGCIHIDILKGIQCIEPFKNQFTGTCHIRKREHGVGIGSGLLVVIDHEDGSVPSGEPFSEFRTAAIGLIEVQGANDLRCPESPICFFPLVCVDEHRNIRSQKISESPERHWA